MLVSVHHSQSHHTALKAPPQGQKTTDGWRRRYALLRAVSVCAAFSGKETTARRGYLSPSVVSGSFCSCYFFVPNTTGTTGQKNKIGSFWKISDVDMEISLINILTHQYSINFVLYLLVITTHRRRFRGSFFFFFSPCGRATMSHVDHSRNNHGPD